MKAIIWLVIGFLLSVIIGCTFIAFNKGPVDARDADSHDAIGTNKASSFDVNFSPR